MTPLDLSWDRRPKSMRPGHADIIRFSFLPVHRILLLVTDLALRPFKLKGLHNYFLPFKLSIIHHDPNFTV